MKRRTVNDSMNLIIILKYNKGESNIGSNVMIEQFL